VAVVGLTLLFVWSRDSCPFERAAQCAVGAGHAVAGGFARC
jgi:hypothetical protein